MRVLVVEDSWHVARALKSVLEQMGMAVAQPAATLADAEQLIAANVFDLAVMDINLKGETTYDLMDRLHDQGVRIVVLSGYPALPNAIREGLRHPSEAVQRKRTAGESAECYARERIGAHDQTNSLEFSTAACDFVVAGRGARV